LVASAPPPGKFDAKLATLFQPPPKTAAKLVLKPAAKPATPAPAAQPAKPALVAAAQASPKPAQKPVVVASAQPAPRPDTGEGDGEVPGRTWTIQIGAFADQALAKAQLDSYAIKAKDVVGQAARIVAPITGANGHTLYRARFGLYEESQARQVCSKLSQRGQTCFAVARR
jgi:cell division protein FtsN